MDINVKKVRDNADALMKAVKALRSEQVLVGVPAKDAARTDGEPINNAALAYIHNYGSPAANIPARPFMEPGIQDAKDDITAELKDAARSAIEGDIKEVEKHLTNAGITAKNSIQNKIITGDFVPLAPATIAARQRAGIASDKPLIRTGGMVGAIDYVLRKK